MNEDAKKIEEISRERVRYIIDNFCDGNRMEFSRRTGIGKSSISQYVNGTNAPGSITAAKIGEAFHLDPMWVMGFDVPMKPNPLKVDLTYFGNDEATLIECYRNLNENNRKHLIQYAKFLKGEE